MTLATADSDGRPSVRNVLLRGFDHRGFRFYTNHDSRKGREVAANPFGVPDGEGGDFDPADLQLPADLSKYLKSLP